MKKEKIPKKVVVPKEEKKKFQSALKYFIDRAFDEDMELLKGNINISFDKDFNQIVKIRLKTKNKFY